ncbi:MAG: DUF6011 domain-containing protein [Candidatus Nanopelagicales bacterium]
MIAKSMLDRHSLNIKTASACIDAMLKLPKSYGQFGPILGGPAISVEKKVGVYDSMPNKPVTEFASGRFFIIYVNTKGQRRAKRLFKSYSTLSGFSWQKTSLSGLNFKIESGAAVWLDKTAVQAVGKHFNFCMCCGATLTDPESMKQSIGPVCAKKFGY